MRGLQGIQNLKNFMSSVHNSMIWLAYVGLGIIAVGGIFLAFASVGYYDYVQTWEELKKLCLSEPEYDSCINRRESTYENFIYEQGRPWIDLSITGGIFSAIGAAAVIIGYRRSSTTRYATTK
ncbi:hypothetical protein [Candidatus Nitrososphaera sp. FF02]|uniref:hypothetical protein n=1 Tax=Candidatus Nitrososphaera sp. FF02 TaxID=3398226 RepID=UPI0039E9F0CE